MKRKRTSIGSNDNKKWYLIDANGKTLGRMSVKIATILRGKNKTIFTPHKDVGDFVIVINAGKVKVTGNKLNDKTYFTHSGFPGGKKFRSFEEMIDRDPEKVIHLAVKGMLPKGALGGQILKKLKVYKGESHNHSAQCPEKIEV